MSDEQWKGRDLSGLVEGNAQWVESMNEEDPEFFKRMGKGQWPKYFYIGCCDARLDPLRMLGLKHGDLFIHRNIGNCCGVADLSFLSALEFAVSFLKVPHIIVCGHYDCGAVRNSGKTQDIGLLENWLRQIRDVHHEHYEELSKIEDPEAKHRRFVELNVIEQAKNVLKTACVQRRWQEKEEGFDFEVPVVHAFVFDVATGKIKKLDDELQLPPQYQLFPSKQ